MTEETRPPGDTASQESYRKRTRRRRTIAEKRQIVEETYAYGSTVSAVARRYGVNANLLFKWRERYKEGAFDSESESTDPALLPVVLSATTSTTAPANVEPPSAGALELVLPSGIAVRVTTTHGLSMLADVLVILESR